MRCTCEEKLAVKSLDHDGTTFLYYALDNFYQNHRRYVQSRWMPQLHGMRGAGKKQGHCENPSKGGSPYAPCGFQANAFFNGEQGRRRKIKETKK